LLCASTVQPWPEADGDYSAAASALLLVAMIAVAARAYDSLKGPIPVVLATTPIASPAGDPGIVLQLIWRADALLLAVIGGAAAVRFGATGASLTLWLALGVVVWCVAGTHRRIAHAA